MLKNISIRYDGYNVAENFKKLFLKFFCIRPNQLNLEDIIKIKYIYF